MVVCVLHLSCSKCSGQKFLHVWYWTLQASWTLKYDFIWRTGFNSNKISGTPNGDSRRDRKLAVALMPRTVKSKRQSYLDSPAVRLQRRHINLHDEYNNGIGCWVSRRGRGQATKMSKWTLGCGDFTGKRRQATTTEGSTEQATTEKDPRGTDEGLYDYQNPRGQATTDERTAMRTTALQLYN